MAALLPVFVAIYFAAFTVRYEGRLGANELEVFIATAPWAVLAKLLAFRWFRIYSGWGKYVTFHDLVALGQAASAGSVLLVVVDGLVLSPLVIPRSVVLLDWGATILGVGGLRAVLRAFREQDLFSLALSMRTPALIVGANDSGEALLRAINRHRGDKPSYLAVGFLDDNAAAVGTCIGGVPIVGTLDRMCELALKLGVREVLITAGGLPGRQVRRLVEDGRRHAIRVRVLPSYEQVLNERVAIQPRPVAIDDLLRREPVRLDMQGIHAWIKDRVVLVSGSAGSIGSEISRQLLQLDPARLILVDRSENGLFALENDLQARSTNVATEICVGDVLDVLRMDAIFRGHPPDIVFHAAAYKHVPIMESHAGEAVKNIALATRLLADLAHQHNVTSFVQISTDKAVNPTSVMGACKRVAEQYVQALAAMSPCRFVTVRFGNVLDSSGSVVPIFRKQIDRGGPVTITHPEMTRYFMTIPEASQLVIQAGAMGRGGEIFVLDMGDPVRIVDLATDMIRLSGLRVDDDIEIECVGLRPGEKLFEQLHAAEEKRLATSHPKIMVAESAPLEFRCVLETMVRLERVANDPTPVVLEQLRQAVPGFHRDGSRKAFEPPVAA